jgi:hypothetical protein
VRLIVVSPNRFARSVAEFMDISIVPVAINIAALPELILQAELYVKLAWKLTASLSVLYVARKVSGTVRKSVWTAIG